MRTLLLLPFLLTPFAPHQSGPASGEASPLVVLAFKWSKSRQTVQKPEVDNTAPAPAIISSNKNYERGRRDNTPAGVANAPAAVRDINADTVDERSAALERNVRASRLPRPDPVDGYAYRVEVENASPRVVEIVYWEYRFTESANPAHVARRQFLCGVQIKPNKKKELRAFSPSAPSNVISAESLAKEGGNLFDERVVINRVEYADGSIWQRKDWHFAEVRAAVARAVATPWGAEMCRGL